MSLSEPRTGLKTRDLPCVYPYVPTVTCRLYTPLYYRIERIAFENQIISQGNRVANLWQANSSDILYCTEEKTLFAIKHYIEHRNVFIRLTKYIVVLYEMTHSWLDCKSWKAQFQPKIQDFSEFPDGWRRYWNSIQAGVRLVERTAKRFMPPNHLRLRVDLYKHSIISHKGEREMRKEWKRTQRLKEESQGWQVRKGSLTHHAAYI